MFRRKGMPDHLVPAWRAFSVQAERVEAARTALLGCLPVGRVARAPVAVGLDTLRDELAAVVDDLEAWHVAVIEDAWRNCATAIEESLDAVEPARTVAATTGELEELLDAVGEVVEPLDAWAAAEAAWRRLRVRA